MYETGARALSPPEVFSDPPSRNCRQGSKNAQGHRSKAKVSSSHVVRSSMASVVECRSLQKAIDAPMAILWLLVPISPISKSILTRLTCQPISSSTLARLVSHLPPLSSLQSHLLMYPIPLRSPHPHPSQFIRIFPQSIWSATSPG